MMQLSLNIFYVILYSDRINMETFFDDDEEIHASWSHQN